MVTKILCDHCSKELIVGEKKSVKAGEKSYDLCKECYDKIVAWLNKKDVKKEEKLGLFN